MPCLEPRAAVGEGELAQVLAVDQQRVVEANVRRELLKLTLGYTLAIEPLLQVIEGRDGSVADHEQFAIKHRIEAESLDNLRKAAG